MYVCSFYSLHNNIHLQTNVKGLQKFITKEKTSCNLNKTKKTSVNKSSLKNEIKVVIAVRTERPSPLHEK